MLFVLGQSGTQTCGMQGSPPSTQTLTGGCNTNSIWDGTNAYIPVDQEIAALTIRVNFIFWQREDGIIGNFQPNNADHNFFIDEVIDEMNRRISNLVDPMDNNCYIGDPDYLKDARIKFDVQKYYIEDGYLWDIENATPNANLAWYCPDWWDQTYTDLAYQRLEEHNVRDGLNVFFGTEGSAFQTLVIDHLTDDFNSVASTVDCSEWPGGQGNLDRRLRVEMTNEFLKYEFRGNITQDPEWQLDFNALKFGTARVTVHEIGHSLSLTHASSGNNCTENIMQDDATARNYLNSNQLGEILNSLHLSSVRQYVVCELAGKKPRVLSGYHRWGFDTKVYTDIILETGAELEICGTVYMPKEGRIHVNRGAKLFVNGGTISFNREEYEKCPDDLWGGIVVWGNRDKLHSEVDVDNLLPDDPGVVILNDVLIEYANLGVDLFSYEIGPSDDSHPEYSGGIIQAEESTFKDCKTVARFTPYPFENDSYFKDCTFFNEESPGVFGGGIRAAGIFHLDVDNCSFRNLGPYGIALLNSGARIHNGCSFSEMTHGVYASSKNLQSPGILIGSYDETIPRNQFTQNTCGVYAFGVRNLEVVSNDFTASNFGIAVKGATRCKSENNIFDQLIIGESFEQSGILEKTSSCNVFSNLSRGIYAAGSNPGLTFNNDEFDDTEINVMLQSKETSSNTTLGSIYSFQGSPSEAAFNLFSVGDIRILADPASTQAFNYYTDLNTDPRFVPECPINFPNGCIEVNNFYLNDAFGTPDPCLDIEQKTICDTKDCLDEKKDAIRLLEQQMDGGDKDALLQQLATAPTANATKQALLDASPYLSDEVLKAVLESSMQAARRAEILLANAALSTEVMQELEGKVSAAHITSLENIKNTNPVSDKDELEHQLWLATQEKNEVLYANIERLIKEGDFVEAETMLLDDNTTLALRTLIELKAAWGDIAAAQSLLQTLPAATIEHIEANDIMAIKIQQYDQGAAFELDALQEARLYAIAEGHSPQAAYAMGLLALLKDEIFVPILPEEKNKALRQSIVNNAAVKRDVKQKRADIRLFPNPTKGSIQMEISTYLDEKLSIRVDNIYGQEVKSVSFDNTGKTSIDLEGLPSGIYTLSIYKGSELLSTQKIVRN